jgi:excisionase family DNA binding protein
MASETPLSDVRFLTVAEVATIMRVSKMTVYRLVHSGELEAIRVGRSFRVPEQAVNQYLRARGGRAPGAGWPSAPARGGRAPRRGAAGRGRRRGCRTLMADIRNKAMR